MFYLITNNPNRTDHVCDFIFIFNLTYSLIRNKLIQKKRKETYLNTRHHVNDFLSRLLLYYIASLD
jgi:hypothetical protein